MCILTNPLSALKLNGMRTFFLPRLMMYISTSMMDMLYHIRAAAREA